MIIKEKISAVISVNLRLNSYLFSKSKWENGQWTVVVGRPLEVKEQMAEAAQFKPGETIKVGWAVMEGSNNERGGAMSFSVYFRNVEIAAV